MKASNYIIPSPSLTVKMWIKVISPGIIFQINDNNSYITILTLLTGYQSKIKTCAINTINCIYYQQSNIVMYSYSWQHIIFTFEFSFTDVTLGIILDKNPANLNTINNFENALGQDGLSFDYFLGNLTLPFNGFIYMISAINRLNVDYLNFIDPPNCLNNEYWNAGCIACNSSCGKWPWCIRGSDCRICFDNIVANCYGYGHLDSFVANYNCSSEFCMQCPRQYACIIPIKDYFLQSVLLWQGDYAIYASTYFYIPMTGNQVSYAMQSGKNTSTDFFNNPDPDDYTPITCRGFYFNAGTFGQTRDLQAIPSNFTFIVWLKGYSGVAISKDSKFQLLYDGSFVIELSNFNLTRNTSYIITSGLSTKWHYIIYIVSYYFYDTTITSYYDDVLKSRITYTNNAFRDNRSYLLIGKNSTVNYSGFIFYIFLANDFFFLQIKARFLIIVLLSLFQLIVHHYLNAVLISIQLLHVIIVVQCVIMDAFFQIHAVHAWILIVTCADMIHWFVMYAILLILIMVIFVFCLEVYVMILIKDMDVQAVI